MSRPLGWVAAVAVLLCAAAPAVADKVFAHSKSLQMTFTALGEPWCGAQVRMQVKAEDVSRFSTDDYAAIIQKLGQVLANECPAAEHLDISGVSVTGDTHWTGTASKADGWLAMARPEAAGDLAAVAPPPPTVPAAPEGEAERVPDPAVMQPVPAEPDPVVTAAPSGTQTEAAPMEIANWRPGAAPIIDGGAPAMVTIPARDGTCLLRTLAVVQAALNPTYQGTQQLGCRDGYAESKRSVAVKLLYEGQTRAFAKLSGIWFDGYNLDRGLPREVVARYRQTQFDNRRRTSTNTDRLLVWTGEDRDLRAHYFAEYSYREKYNYWALDTRAPFIVLTDNEALQRDPVNSTLAQSLAEMNRVFLGHQNTEQFASVDFVIVDQLHNAPGHKQLALSTADLDPSVYMQGQAVRSRGIPWHIKVTSDFGAMRMARAESERQRAEAEREAERRRVEAEREAEQRRVEAEREAERRRVEAERQRQEAQLAAEQRRAEAERQRQEALRQQQQAALQRQFTQLQQAVPYDRLRFYATLKLAPDLLQASKIDLAARRAGEPPYNRAVRFTHPAMYFDRARDGEVKLNGPLYMLVRGAGGHIQQPYPIKVDYNEAQVEIEGWLLVQLAPQFRVEFDDQGEPVFEVTVQEALACPSARCAGETDPAAMMRAWYDDAELSLSMVDGE